MIAGIAGINPACGTIGSVAFAKYAVQVGLEYEIDPRELSKNYTSASDYIPLGAKKPNTLPPHPLRQRGLLPQRGRHSVTAAGYPHAPATRPPQIVKGDVATSDVYFHGALLSHSFGRYVALLTNGTGSYCMTAQEDNAILEAMIRGAWAQKVDFTRLILLRSASDFDRPPPGEEASESLLYGDEG